MTQSSPASAMGSPTSGKIRLATQMGSMSGARITPATRYRTGATGATRRSRRRDRRNSRSPLSWPARSLKGTTSSTRIPSAPRHGPRWRRAHRHLYPGLPRAERHRAHRTRRDQCRQSALRHQPASSPAPRSHAPRRRRHVRACLSKLEPTSSPTRPLTPSCPWVASRENGPAWRSALGRHNLVRLWSRQLEQPAFNRNRNDPD